VKLQCLLRINPLTALASIRSSDIFGATVESLKGNKSVQDVWLMGEDITLSGAGVRNMVRI
jgi:Zn-dependent metalloprotease